MEESVTHGTQEKETKRSEKLRYVCVYNATKGFDVCEKVVFVCFPFDS